MLVNEIFTSIEGEGIRTGYPVTFIRLYGCNLNCSYCDTRYSCEGKEGTEMNIEQIIRNVNKRGVKRVTLTGGEPLIHRDVESLVISLLENYYEVNIETNGSVDIYPYIQNDGIIVTMDYKSISSGENDKMQLQNLKYLRPDDVLKFVVGSLEDLEDMKNALEKHDPRCNIFVSPVFGKIEMQDIVEFLLDNQLTECRMQVQLHKIIWEPSTRGV